MEKDVSEIATTLTVTTVRSHSLGFCKFLQQSYLTLPAALPDFSPIQREATGPMAARRQRTT